MRWGVRDEASNDHTTTELCMSELHACRNLSTGPYFVVRILIVSMQIYNYNQSKLCTLTEVCTLQVILIISILCLQPQSLPIREIQYVYFVINYLFEHLFCTLN